MEISKLEREVEKERHQAERELERREESMKAKEPKKKKNIWYERRRDSENSELKKKNLLQESLKDDR